MTTQGDVAETANYASTLDRVMQHVIAVAKERAKNLEEDTNVVDLGLDSLERMDVIARIEEEFSIRIPEAVVMDIETCREISDAVDQYSATGPAGDEIPAEYYQLDQLPEWIKVRETIKSVEAIGERNPFFTAHEAVSNNTTTIGGRQLINFSGYNYLGMSGDPQVTEAAKAALDQYGTSVSASRLVSGTKPLHEQLESTLAEFTGCEQAVTFVSGYLTNGVVIGHLMQPGDLIVHDELAHNSIVFGVSASGAERRTFPHNDWQALDDLLKQHRKNYRKVLIVVEGVYSMDGDFPELPRFVDVKKRHHALLMVDEAHSIGTMGRTGRGMAEYFDLNQNDVEVWMGTLGKAFGACGGYIAGRQPFIEYMKHTCPGIVYSIGLSPASAAGSLQAVQILQQDSERVTRLQQRAAFFLAKARQSGLNTGDSGGTPIVPVILGNSLHALQASRMMHQRGVSVQPILHPAVPEEGARLRFFITSLHTEQQIVESVEILAGVLRELCPNRLKHDEAIASL